MMRIGVPQEDLTETHPVEGIPRGRLAVAENDIVVSGAVFAFVSERNRLRQTVGVAEMFAAYPVFVEAEVEREPVNDFHVVRGQRTFNRICPGLDGGLVRVVEQQERMHCFRGDDLTLVALNRAADLGERAFPRLCALLLARRNVGAPAWPAFDDGALPFVMDLVAKTPEPVFLIHALPKRRREGSQRVR